MKKKDYKEQMMMVSETDQTLYKCVPIVLTYGAIILLKFNDTSLIALDSRQGDSKHH